MSDTPDPVRKINNASIALSLMALVAGMVMLAYASVPLYRIFCQVTGYGGTTQRAEQIPTQIFDRVIKVRFNADIDPALPWEFRPEEPSVPVRVGENRLTSYYSHNLSDKPVTGHAIYNVVPDKAGEYFAKVECFCFTDQTLKAGEEVIMPVSFFIDPAIMDDPNLDDVSTITLSYTFFPAKSDTTE